MKTTVLMQRELMNGKISQHNQTGMLSMTDLLGVGNKWRTNNNMSLFSHTNWFNTKATKEFVAELERKYGKSNVRKNSRGKGHHTWLHPVLFIDMALAINPTLKVEVYEWMYDQLIKNRNDSSDSYRRMCGALYVRTTKKSSFDKSMQKLALKIKRKIGVNDWQTATEEQLKKRDKLHENIELLVNAINNNSEAIRLAFIEFDKHNKLTND